MNNISNSQYPTCASCQYCLEVRCHPWNESIGKGSCECHTHIK